MKNEQNKARFPEPNDDPKEKCPRCGKHIKYKNSKYCTNCGQELNK